MGWRDVLRARHWYHWTTACGGVCRYRVHEGSSWTKGTFTLFLPVHELRVGSETSIQKSYVKKNGDMKRPILRPTRRETSLSIRSLEVIKRTRGVTFTLQPRNNTWVCEILNFSQGLGYRVFISISPLTSLPLSPPPRVLFSVEFFSDFIQGFQH